MVKGTIWKFSKEKNGLRFFYIKILILSLLIYYFNIFYGLD
jgi:hypothetical protein